MAPKTERRHAQGEASRQTILDATLRLAGERGYVGTTMSRVEKATGLSASSLYWHFHSKDELLMQALDHGWTLWRTQVQPWRESEAGTPLTEAIFANLVRGAAYFEDEPGFWRTGLLLSLESGPAVHSGPRERFIEIRSQALAQLQGWWMATADAAPDQARRLALFTLAILDGLYIRHQCAPSGDLGRLLRLLAEGLATLATTLVGSGSTALPEPGSPTAPPPAAAAAPADGATTEPASSRERLLEAAHQLAAESGYEGATISRICATAGLPASSLYYHFKDKDGLFAAAVDHSYHRWQAQQQVWRAPASGTDGREELHRHLVGTATSLITQPPFLRLGYLLVLLRRREPLLGRDRFLAARAQRLLLAENWWRETTGDPTDRPQLLAQLAMAGFDGLYFSTTLDDGAWEPRDFAAFLLQVLVATAPLGG